MQRIKRTAIKPCQLKSTLSDVKIKWSASTVHERKSLENAQLLTNHGKPCPEDLLEIRNNTSSINNTSMVLKILFVIFVAQFNVSVEYFFI